MIDYYLLTKPGIILGNLITFAAGFFLASKGVLYPGLFLATFLGLGLIIASACVFNNYIDRNMDKKMKRTQERPLVVGSISGVSALFFGLVLAGLGSGVLLAFTNLLTFVFAALGFFVYVALYSFLKGSTTLATAIGSVAGALPPVIGYVAVSHNFDLGAFILFIILVFWQMPHFFSIALFNYEDYAAADIPVLPVKKGILRTKIHMVLYIGAFILAISLLTLFHFTGYAFFVVMLSFGVVWLFLSLQGFLARDITRWGRRMFQVSLMTIAAFCIMVYVNFI